MFIKYIILMLLLCCSIVNLSPTREELEVEDNDKDSFGFKGNLGKKTLDKFDEVFYGLLDEALQYVTDDKKGAFKDMVLRHRSDFVNNVKQNLVNKDKITLDDVKATMSREMNNRLELFKYLGTGIWNKLNLLSRNIYGQYRDYCNENSKSFVCFNGRSDDGESIKINNNNEIEREFEQS